MKEVKQKVYWLRKGNEGLLVSNLWANKENAELTAKGKNLELKGSHLAKTEFKVIPCTLMYKE